MADEQKPVIYDNGFKPKEESQMYQHGKYLAANPPATDYTNSNRSKREKGLMAPESNLPAPPSTEFPKVDGFFRATLKQAMSAAYFNVIDPAIRSFLDNTFTSVLKTMIWGKDARTYIGPGGQTDYRKISTSSTGVVQNLPAGPQLSQEDRNWQRYERCFKRTKEEAYAVMSRLYRKLRMEGKVTLADYLQAFDEKAYFTDEGWGWTSLPDEEFYAHMYEGYYHVHMPKLEVLDSELRR